MDFMIPVLAAVVGLIVIAFLGITFITRTRGGGRGLKYSKGRDAIIKSAERVLEHNPKDPHALSELGDLYYREESWDQVYKTYKTLSELGHKAPNEFQAYLRLGLAAIKLNLADEAFKALSAAKLITPNSLEVNSNLGVLEFQRKNYEKAIQLLNQARIQDPEHAPTLRTLGHSYFRIKKNKEAMVFIRKAIEIAPDDKESLFTLAECYHEANQSEQALRIFSHLRGDPQMGASACLTCGTMHTNARHYDKAIADFELGLRHENIKPEVRTDLSYRLAQACLKVNDISRALTHLRNIQAEVPTYKDVSVLISKYQELNTNKNLQIYLMSPSGDFVALCRKIVIGYFPKAKVKIANITVNKNEWADILVEVDTPRWSDVIMFRFIRSQGSVGELIVRDFHSHIKEVKASKGVCVSVGSFTDEARRYTEARLIDLIEKDKLSAILNNVDARIAQGKSAVLKK